jgi:putative hydrolase of the HAD superfamily
VSLSNSVPSPDPTPGCQLHDWKPPKESPRVVPATRRRGLILDLDDTLYAREEYVQSGLMAVARHLEERHDVPAIDAFTTMSRARRDGRQGSEMQMLCAGHGLPETLIPELVEVFRTHTPVLRLPRTTGAVLTRLRAERWRMVVLTNGRPSVQQAKIAALGLEALVDDTLYAEEIVAGGKPAVQVFRAALERLGVPALRCIAVGDDPVRDVAGARAAGLKTVRVITGAPVDPAVDADATIDSLDALPAVVNHLLELVTPDAA